MLPGGEIDRRKDDLRFRLAFQVDGVVGAAGDTQPAADAVCPVHHREIVPFRDGMHLAAPDAVPAGRADHGVDHGNIAGKRHRVRDAPFVDAAQDGTAAAAAVADVAHPLHDVADGVHQADLFAFFQDCQGFFPRNKAGTRGACFSRKTQAHIEREIALAAAKLVLLEAADAVLDVEAVGIQQDGTHIFVGQHRLGLHGAVGGEHAVQGGLRFHDPLARRRAQGSLRPGGRARGP